VARTVAYPHQLIDTLKLMKTTDALNLIIDLLLGAKWHGQADAQGWRERATLGRAITGLLPRESSMFSLAASG